MATTVVSAKGQVVLPKAFRDSMGFVPGTRLKVGREGGRMTLEIEDHPFPPTTDEEVFGCLRYDGPPVPVEEMNDAIGQMIVEDWERFEAEARVGSRDDDCER